MLKIALLQMTSHGFNQKANLEKGIDFCYQASKIGADIALFPEMWNIGYTPYDKKVFEPHYNPNDQSELKKRIAWQQHAIDKEDHFIQSYQNLAKELNLAIAITYLEKWPNAPRNSMSLINRHGEIVLTYAKVHTCDFSLEAACTSGDEFFVVDLDTTKGPIKIGGMICFDREFPESARVLMLKGAEIVLVPNACDLDAHRLCQIQTRALENMFGIAVANYAVPQENGYSVAFDGMAYDEEGKPRDMKLVQADQNEGIFIAEFNIQQLRDYRQREVWGNAYRKPRSYKMLIEEEKNDPFVRKKAKELG